MNMHVGLDVGSRTTAMGWRNGGRFAGQCNIEQTPAGRKAAVSKLLELKPLSVVMEATGIYYLDLAMELAAAGLPVSVINPKSFHNFAKLMLKNSKTDAIDAQLLAEYGERMSPRLWTPPTSIQLELRAIGRHINRLTCHRTRAKNELHALKATQTTLLMLIEDEEEAIKAFDKRIERFRLAGRALIDNCPTLSAQFGHMIAAPGMGEISVFAALAELTTLPVTLKSAQVSRHAGLDVRLTQSGTSIDKPGRISKGGNAYLRSAMYMPALTAIRCDPNVKAFYEALVARGKRKMQAIVAVMRKYLTGLWACMQAGEDFDTTKLLAVNTSKKLDRKQSIAAPGMGEISVFAALAELTTLPVTLKSAQVSRHAGLDVRLTQSGTSIDKPGRISKGGNAYLRSAMYMPALTAIRCDPNVKAFYEALVARGKRKMQAIVAVMRKYLTGLWACMQAGEDFDTTKLFSGKHLQKA